MISQKAFHGYKSPLYQKITHFSFQFMENDLFGSFSRWQITTVSANNACIVGRVSYPATSGCYLSGMESRPTIYFTVNN